jgi:UDP-N-acetylmuramoyl-L-alanyl-D-glutamate--2,6-diaminopimelate ligase
MPGTSFDLRDLLGPGGATAPAGVKVTGICLDSRQVKSGDVFFALAGSRSDGRKFISEAAGRGAVAVVGEGPRPFDLSAGVAYISVQDGRAVLAHSAARIHPKQPKTIVAITGTNGKTSVASFTRQIWTALGHASASIGTIGVTAPSGEIKGSLTTPDPVALHALLDKLASEGVTHLAMEASSHGLEQRRLDGVRLAAGAFTNLSRDHLDYHLSMDAYRAAKLRLFEKLLPAGSAAVADADQPDASLVAGIAEKRKLKYLSVGRKGRDLMLLDTKRDGFAQLLTIRADKVEKKVKLPLVGEFQVSNALVAAALVIATGANADETINAIRLLTGASGRLEFVGERSGSPVFVDYAHTPDALENALNALRPYVTGRLVVVFGAGGDRDAGKRPLMGAVAVKRADKVYVTDDNPRSEDPALIRKAILAAAPGAFEIVDRKEAIGAAIRQLERGDVLLIAGKGHETGQILRDRTLPFSDQAAVRAALGINA